MKSIVKNNCEDKLPNAADIEAKYLVETKKNKYYLAMYLLVNGECGWYTSLDCKLITEIISWYDLRNEIHIDEIDPKYLGIPNIQFSLTDKNDSREENFKKDRILNGFDESETWNLSSTICRFIIPRLKRFIEITDGMFTDNSEYINKCKRFLKALEASDSDDNNDLNLFAEILPGLGW